ncbi:MAG: hypothetical protein QOH13_2503 [Thermoleophilaceae bacterium]|nr:hypothetical protein [Thermoleophilaceae bacterium]
MRITAAAGGLLLLTQIVLLVVQLHVLTDSRAHIRSQDSKITRLYPPLEKTALDAQPLIRDVRGLVKPLRGQSGRITRATGVLPELADSTQTLVDEAVPAMRGTRQLIAAILGRDLVTTVERVAADGHAARGIAGESLAILRRSERIQMRTLGILRQSLAIQRATLQHAESLDRKTGGSAPTQGVSLPTP